MTSPPPFRQSVARAQLNANTLSANLGVPTRKIQGWLMGDIVPKRYHPPLLRLVPESQLLLAAHAKLLDDIELAVQVDPRQVFSYYESDNVAMLWAKHRETWAHLRVLTNAYPLQFPANAVHRGVMAEGGATVHDVEMMLRKRLIQRRKLPNGEGFSAAAYATREGRARVMLEFLMQFGKIDKSGRLADRVEEGERSEEW